MNSIMTAMPLPGMSLRAAIREDIKRQRGTTAVAATIMGVGHPQTVLNYTCDTKRDTHDMSLKQFEALLEWTDAQYTAHAVAEIAGGFFVPGVDPVQGVDLFEQMANSVARVGELGQAINEAIADQRVTVSEMNRIKQVRTELAAEINTLVSIAAGMPG
ncbi:phage regulatory CII family protein [Thalassolituus sp.]|uniref:phage regulatory CII family protein n=1 Tax=Thalassolituus sp. TaxID=2030822 RepID=UPI002615B02C|nr:phage regulatory CII family protein [Thalassolituus sp.]